MHRGCVCCVVRCDEPDDDDDYDDADDDDGDDGDDDDDVVALFTRVCCHAYLSNMIAREHPS